MKTDKEISEDVERLSKRLAAARRKCNEPGATSADRAALDDALLKFSRAAERWAHCKWNEKLDRIEVKGKNVSEVDFKLFKKLTGGKPVQLETTSLKDKQDHEFMRVTKMDEKMVLLKNHLLSDHKDGWACKSAELQKEVSDGVKELRDSWKKRGGIRHQHPESILYEVTRLELNSIFRKLKTKSAPGMDGLTNKLLKNDKHYALQWIVQSLVNLSLTSRRFFDAWKKMVMTVVPKNKKDMTRYYFISPDFFA